jgi:threonine/homoserine/homoserine lactone efflux protein
MVYEGILLGLTLSFMVGPLLFAIVQASLERGFRAGLSVAAGIWLSDVLYLALLFRSMEALDLITSRPDFKLWAGLAGGVVLLLFGTASLMKKPPAPDAETAADHLLDRLDGPERPGVAHNWQTWGYAGYALRGFLLNTINPFTVFFWMGLASAVIIPNQWHFNDALPFFGGMLGTLVLTDTLKAWAAKRVRRFLTPGHTLWVQKAIGVVLLVFGVVLMVRVV